MLNVLFINYWPSAALGAEPVLPAHPDLGKDDRNRDLATDAQGPVTSPGSHGLTVTLSNVLLLLFFLIPPFLTIVTIRTTSIRQTALPVRVLDKYLRFAVCELSSDGHPCSHCPFHAG
jgi:hypothetical protein